MKKISFFYIFISSTLLLLLLASNDKFLLSLPIYHGTKFQDLRYIFEYGECLRKIPNNYCANYEVHPFVYPKIWLFIGKYTNIFYGTIFYIFLVFLYFIISIITFKNIKNKNIYHFLFFFSPASLLLIIRGNNDIVIFLLTYLSIILLEKNKLKIISFSLFLLTFFLKIYTIFLITVFFIKKKNFNYINYLFFLIFIIFSFYFANEILEISRIYNKSKILAAYSSSTISDLFNYLNFKIKINSELFSKFTFLMISLLSFTKYNVINYNISKKNNLLFISGSIILVSSFFLSRTFDYKLIFILLIIPAIFEIKEKKNSKLINLILLSIFLILWFESVIFYYSKYINYQENKFIYLQNYSSEAFILGFMILIKNIFQWIINIFMIFLSKNLVIKNFYK